MADPRASTDEETAPLLDGRDVGNDGDDGDDNTNGQGHSILSALGRPSRPLTLLEKLLAVAAIVLLVLAGTFVGLFAGAESALERNKHAGKPTVTTTVFPSATSSPAHPPRPAPTGAPGQTTCLTRECVLLSAEILKSLNTSADPCDDFYEFANGGWEASHSIPADRGVYGSFIAVSDRNKEIMLKIVQAIPQDIGHSTPEQSNLAKLKNAFTSCQNVDYLDTIGIDPLVEQVNTLINLIGPFDLVPAPDTDLVETRAEWAGTYDESYTLPPSLVKAAENINTLKRAKATGNKVWDTPSSNAELQDDYDASQSLVKNDNKESITNTLAWIHSRGVGALVDFSIEGDAGGQDSQVQSLWLYQAEGGLPAKEYYEEKPVLDLYTSVVKGILVDLAKHTEPSSSRKDTRNLAEEDMSNQDWPWPWPGDGDKTGDDNPGEDKPPHNKDEPVELRLERLAEQVVAFERELVRAGADPEYVYNPRFAYNPYSTQKVEKHLPFFDLATYLSSFAIRAFPENITVTHPPYLKAVSTLVATTSDHVLSGYFVTRLALSYASALGPKTGVWKEHRKLEELLKGLKKGTEENRQDFCLSRLDSVVGYIAGAEFVHEVFSPEAKKDGEDIINGIVNAFYDKLPHIAWMDEESAKAAQKKARSIIPKIGYPLWPDTANPAALAAWYRDPVESDDFFGNVLRTAIAGESRSWAVLGRQRNRDSWEMYPQTVNAYYSPPDGEIVFPAGILQPPFFSHEWPAHLKYGAFGAVAAHELTHAFDNAGSQYDENGRLRDWWTNSTVEAFEERAQCIAKQYSTYYVLDAEGNKVYVNGNFTNGEDIGDSGLAQAFIAWKNAASQAATFEKEGRLPGLDYTDEQLFFIAFARVWAQLTRPAVAVSRVRSDPHSPNYWRTVGTLRNLPAFHEAYGCKKGSRMNPKDQCALW